LKKEYEITIKWRAFPLHPDSPQEGLLLEKLFATNPEGVEKMMQHLMETAASIGLPLGKREKTYNSRLAQELGLWAESKNRGDQFHMAAFKAYFVDGKNLATISVLLDIAGSVGLPEKEALNILDSRIFKAAVDSDWELSRKKGITGVPVFVMNHDKLVGAQPYDMLAQFVQANGVLKRTAL
jgi:predicted DsbA family dithiol-disulfide isomerase